MSDSTCTTHKNIIENAMFSKIKICIMITVIFLARVNCHSYTGEGRIQMCFFLQRLSSCHLHSVASFTCRTFPVAYQRTYTNQTFHVLILISFDINACHISYVSVYFKILSLFFFCKYTCIYLFKFQKSSQQLAYVSVRPMFHAKDII